MTDYLKQILNIGDTVVFINSWYKTLQTGTITKFTKHMVNINGNKRYPSTICKIIPLSQPTSQQDEMIQILEE